jgi:hypothetical protein
VAPLRGPELREPDDRPPRQPTEHLTIAVDDPRTLE